MDVALAFGGHCFMIHTTINLIVGGVVGETLEWRQEGGGHVGGCHPIVRTVKWIDRKIPKIIYTLALDGC